MGTKSMNVLYKTKMCSYHLAGNCCHRDACLHAHSEAELLPLPDFKKTKPCRMFQKGLCRDPDCKRAHGDHELRRVVQFYKKKLCKYWKEQGTCIRGKECFFAHCEEEMAPQNPPSQTTCQFDAKFPRRLDSRRSSKSTEADSISGGSETSWRNRSNRAVDLTARSNRSSASRPDSATTASSPESLAASSECPSVEQLPANDALYSALMELAWNTQQQQQGSAISLNTPATFPPQQVQQQNNAYHSNIARTHVPTSAPAPAPVLQNSSNLDYLTTVALLQSLAATPTYPQTTYPQIHGAPTMPAADMMAFATANILAALNAGSAGGSSSLGTVPNLSGAPSEEVLCPVAAQQLLTMLANSATAAPGATPTMPFPRF